MKKYIGSTQTRGSLFLSFSFLLVTLLGGLSGCSSTNPKFTETIGSGEDAVKMRYKKPKTEINLPKTAVISCDSQCTRSVTKVYEFEHVESDTDNAACKYKFSIPCYPFSCDGKKYACSTSCTSNDQCAARAVCDVDTKQCVPATAAELKNSSYSTPSTISDSVPPPAPTSTPAIIAPLDPSTSTSSDATPSPTPASKSKKKKSSSSSN